MPQKKDPVCRSRSLYKNIQNSVLFFLIPSNTSYLHVIHNLCWIILKMFPKGKERTFTCTCILEYACVFSPSLNESINIIFSKSTGFGEKKKATKVCQENNLSVNLIHWVFAFLLPKLKELKAKDILEMFSNLFFKERYFSILSENCP